MPLFKLNTLTIRRKDFEEEKFRRPLKSKSNDEHGQKANGKNFNKNFLIGNKSIAID